MHPVHSTISFACTPYWYKILSNKEQPENSSFKLFTHKNSSNPYERFHIQHVWIFFHCMKWTFFFYSDSNLQVRRRSFFFLSTCQCTVCQSFQILSQKDSNLETMIRAFVVLSKWCGVRYYEIVILITVLRNQLLPSVTIILNFKISVTNW